jgi:ubiquinone/menaquinone biosynthesis C-methylase UbiE
MKSYEFKQLHDAEQSYWWHVGRLIIIKKQLQQLIKAGLPKNAKILNIGAGTGGTIATLEGFGEVTNADIASTAITYLRQSGYRADRLNGIKLPYRDHEFDLIVGLDVLEHIERDDLALVEWCRVLKPNGYMMLTVPAYQWLWSAHDNVMAHFRRYSLRSLRQKVNKLPVHVYKASYMIVFSFPLIVTYRLIRRQRNHVNETSFVRLPPPLNRLFIYFLSVEASLQTKLNFPFGSSVMIIARKYRQ